VTPLIVGRGKVSAEPPVFRFVPCQSRAGKELVRDEIQQLLKSGPPRKELGALLTRIQRDKQLPDDTKSLGDGLWEARLDYGGNAYRLYYGKSAVELVLVMVKFAKKGGQGEQARAVKIARKRWADWRRSGI